MLCAYAETDAGMPYQCGTDTECETLFGPRSMKAYTTKTGDVQFKPATSEVTAAIERGDDSGWSGLWHRTRILRARHA
jgi:hypothetical protein